MPFVNKFVAFQVSILVKQLIWYREAKEKESFNKLLQFRESLEWKVSITANFDFIHPHFRQTCLDIPAFGYFNFFCGACGHNRNFWSSKKEERAESYNKSNIGGLISIIASSNFNFIFLWSNKLPQENFLNSGINAV